MYSKPCRLLLVILALSWPAAEVAAEAIFVPQDFATIQDGIGAASPGDTVQVACGEYMESNINLISDITLRSETGDPACVTIDAMGGYHVLIGTDLGAAIFTCADSRPHLEACLIAHNDGDGAIYAYDAPSVPIVSCCDAFENVGGNYGGLLEDPTGQNGNISQDPTFCDVEAGDLTLAGGEVLPAGAHEMTWGGRTADGSLAGPGVYYYRYVSEERQSTGRIAFVR